jgi:hypothetical protein
MSDTAATYVIAICFLIVIILAGGGGPRVRPRRAS